MKKALSLILALILALTMALPAFAADNEVQLKLGEPKQVSVKADGETKVTFTPEEDGIYAFSFLDGAPLYAYDFGYDFGYIDYWDYDKEISEEAFIGEKGKPCTITFYGEDFDCSFSVEVNELSCGSLADGTNSVKLRGYGNLFTFVPENSGYYNFASSCEEDVYFEIIDADDFWDMNDDNGYEDDYNFDCTVSLEAGKTYLVNLSVYSEEDAPETVDCDVIVTYGKTEKVEDIEFYGSFYRCGNKWIMSKNSIELLYNISLIPSGSAPTADVKVTSGDESLITVEADEEFGGYIVTSGNKTGKTVITVTAGDAAKDMQVKVCNDFEWFFVSLWNSFNNFLLRVFHFRFA